MAVIREWPMSGPISARIAAAGPFLVGFFSQLARDNGTGVLSLIILFIVGGVLLTRVRDDAGSA